MRNGQLILRSQAVPSAPPIELSEGTMVLGRHSACDIVLLDPSISRHHAEFSVRGSLVTVRDLGSHNGTYLDGKRIEVADVRAGHRLSFGDVSFQVRIAGVDDSVPDSDLETDSVSGRVRSITAELDKLPLHPLNAASWISCCWVCPKRRSPRGWRSAPTPSIATWARSIRPSAFARDPSCWPLCPPWWQTRRSGIGRTSRCRSTD